MFPCECCQISKNTFFKEHLWTIGLHAVSDIYVWCDIGFIGEGKWTLDRYQRQHLKSNNVAKASMNFIYIREEMAFLILAEAMYKLSGKHTNCKDLGTILLKRNTWIL